MCKVNRTFGVELEGYVDTDLEGVRIEGWEGVEDGSLEGGSVECSHCDSDGEVYRECDTCAGDGYEMIPCDCCDGDGYHDCQDCDGMGTWEDDEGEEHECDYCTNGKIDCVNCDGHGENEVQCEYCCGSGHAYYTCTHCEGNHWIDSDRYAVEFVSPKLKDMNTFEELFSKLEYHEWEVDDTCGTHIHVDGRDFDAKDVQKLVYLMSAIEPIFYGLVSGSRYNGRYCQILDHNFAYKVIDNEDINEVAISEALYGRVRSRGNLSKYESERYYGLNIHSWFYRGSFEFRYFDGCDDIDDLKQYVELCTKVVDFAKNATIEQLVPIVDKFYNCYESDKLNAVNVLNDVLGLEYKITLHKVGNLERYINENLMDKYEFETISDVAV